MARKAAIKSSGLYIALPGYDALGGVPSQLVFNPDVKQLLQVGSGSFTLSDGIRRNFGVTLVEPPLVLCGVFTGAYTNYPVRTEADTTGFNAYATPFPNGATPAIGASCQWVAFVRSR